MAFWRRAPLWRGLGALMLAGFVLWRLGPTSFAGRQTSKPQISVADFGQWTFIGPTHLAPTGDPNAWSGRVTSIAVDPVNPNHWLAGAAMGGVWDTPDAGVTWQTRTDGQPSLAIGAIAFSPSSPSVVYVGTGEANFARWQYAGAGMLRSTDSGTTWSVVNTATFARASVKAIVVHPSDADVVMAATTRGFAGRDLGRVTAPPTFGVHRSTDGGQTWTRVLTGQISALVNYPGDFSRQYAVVGDPQGQPTTNNNGDFQPGTMPNGLYRTSDSGDHWTLVTGPWTSTDPAAFGSGYVALAIAPSNAEVMYASVQGPRTSGGAADNLLGLFRTNNAWAASPEWVRIPLDGVTTGTAPGYCDQCGYAHSISVDPADTETLFAGGGDVWRCRSCATRPTWTKVSGNGVGPQGDMHVDQHAFAWVGNRVIVTNDGGVFSSIDRGATWKPHNVNLPLIQFYGGAVHPTSANLILGNTQDNLRTRFTGGQAWERMASSLLVAEGQVLISSRRADTDWGANFLRSIVGRTTDGGRSFQQVQGDIDFRAGGTVLPFMPTFRKCPGNDDVVFVGANRLWKTPNFFSAPAPSWSVNAPDLDPSRCPPGFPRPGAVTECVVIHSIAFAGSDASCNAYAYGTGGGFLRITANGGTSWSDFDPADAVPNRAVTGIAFAAGDPNIAYVTLSGSDEGTQGQGKPGHVFKSTNALAASPSWTNVSPPANIPFNAIAIDPESSNTIYAGADNGVWASRDGGATWAQLDAGMPNVAVFDLQIQASTRKVFAFTFGRGAFMLTPP